MSKRIEGYEKYSINEHGEVFSHQWGKKRKLKPQRASQSKKGYYQVRLYDNSGKLGKLQYVHRLVYQTFVGEIPDGTEIDHKDDNPANNTLSNLQLLSHRGNMEKYNKKNNGRLLRESREELIKDYEELGTFQKVADKWQTSLPSVHRVIRNRVDSKVNGKYITKTYDDNIKDKYSL